MQHSHHLSTNELSALTQIKARIAARFPVKDFILFGSKVRGDFLPESDIDLLIITHRQLSRSEKHQISHIITEVNRHRDTLFSFVALWEEDWESELYRHFSLYQSVEKEGVLV